MRFIYKILLGFLLFNAVLIMFHPYFPTGIQTDDAVDVTGSGDYTEYSKIGEQNKMGGLIVQMIVTGGGIFAAALVVGIFSRNLTLFMGAGAFLALVSALFVGTTKIFVPIINLASGSPVAFNVISAIYTLIMIGIGIITTIAVVEMFTGQQGGD